MPLFDEHLQPNPPLLKLLRLVGMPLNSPTTLLSINTWAQSHLLRQGERWEKQNPRFERLTSDIQPLLEDFGFVHEISPHFKSYEGAIIHGALLSTVCFRLHYLIKQWQEEGVRFQHLYFLGGDRPLEPSCENIKEMLSSNALSLLIRKDATLSLNPPTTEHEMMQWVWNHSEIPQHLRESVIVHFIQAPMKSHSQTHTLIRPTTEDTVYKWLEASPSPGLYLAVSNAPYILRQDLVIKSIAGPEFHFDTVGPKAHPYQRMSIFLDELARLIFQIKNLI
jgi:hypothetical protein